MAGRGTGPTSSRRSPAGWTCCAASTPTDPPMSLTEVADRDRPGPADRAPAAADAARSSATSASTAAQFALTPKVLQLGMAYVSALGLWDIARPHLAELVALDRASRRRWPSSTAPTSSTWPGWPCPRSSRCGSTIGTRFPAPRTSQGKVLLAALDDGRAGRVLAEPSRSGLPPFLPRDPARSTRELREVRARGWALADEELAPGVRSVAAPVRDGTGTVRAAMNVTVHAAETSVRHAGRTTTCRSCCARPATVSAEWALWQTRPLAERTA